MKNRRLRKLAKRLVKIIRLQEKCARKLVMAEKAFVKLSGFKGAGRRDLSNWNC